MKFLPKYAGLTIPVIDEQVVWNSDGAKRVTRQAIVAEFGESALFGEEVSISDLDGNPSPVADIRVGIYDTDEAARLKGWTEDEHRQVDEKLLSFCANNPAGIDPIHRRQIDFGCVEVYAPAKPVAPWPTYDEMHWSEIVKQASALGFEQQVVIYEERTKNRSGILDPLRERLTQAVEAEQLTAVGGE